MRQELSLLIRHVRNPVPKKAGGLDMVTGRLNDMEVAIASTGIGKVRAAAATQALIDAFAPGEVWCIGLGGALDEKLKAGDVVIADELYQHDLDLSGGSRVAALLTKGRGASLVKCDKRLVEAASAAAMRGQTPIAKGDCHHYPSDPDGFSGREPGTGGAQTPLRGGQLVDGDCHLSHGKRLTPNQIHVGRIVTGDRAVLKTKDRKELARRTRALCVEMEGAAVGYTCARNRIPFIVIRAVSDTAGGSALLQFAKNAKRVAQIPQQIALSMLHRRGVYPEQGRGAENAEENEGRNDG